MTRTWIARFTAYALAGLLVLFVLALLIIYLGSEYILRREYVPEPRAAQFTPARSQINEGRRLATLTGCNGCHKANLQGSEFFSEPYVATIHASNLTRALPNYDSGHFEAAVRQGIRPNGRSLFAMPSSSFVALDDRDLAAIESYLRSFPPQGEIRPALSTGILGRIGLLMGRFEPEAAFVARARWSEPFQMGAEHERGRYLTRIVCSECHGLDLTGGEGTPDLSIAAAYELEDFRRLLRTGVPVGGRDLGLMSRVARSRFTSFTDQEINQLHGYLRARAQNVPAR